jgi:Uma2 family endonuclease
MNTTVLPKARMNVEEFLAWSERQPDDRYELVDGEIVAMTRDTVGHNVAKLEACIALRDAVRAAGLPCWVFIDGVGVAIGDRTLRIPDVVVQCGSNPDPDAMIVDAPVVVLEVVSPSSERDDVGVKLLDYFSVASIRHYLVVFSKKRIVMHHRRNDQGTIDTRFLNDGDVALDPPGLTISIPALLGPPSLSLA